MLSPAAQHRMKASMPVAESYPPAELPRPEPVAEIAGNTAFHETVLMGQFKADYYKMGHIKSRSRRVDAKRHALERYQEWLNAFLNRQGWEGREASMFVWLLLWHIDTGDWKRGVELARFALTAGFCSPKDFSRTLAETVCEEIVGGILKSEQAANHADTLDDLAQLVVSHDLTDQITAKLYKARGLARLTIDPTAARVMLVQALELDSHAGVKRHLKALDTPNTPKDEKPAVKIQEFSLSAAAAAKVANMTAPAFLRHAKKHPDLLPRVEIPIGKRTLYRFNPKHVRAYMKQHLVKEV